MQNFDLKLTLNDINIVLQALGNAPYVTVAEVIAKIREQAQPQIEAAPAPATEESD